MVIKPTGLNIGFEEKKQSQVNGVAVFIFLILLIISSAAAVWMAIEKVQPVWIITELLVVNIIGLYDRTAADVLMGAGPGQLNEVHEVS